ncbi:MAG: (d)CMP kinase [Chloroflexota bacterium]
MTQNQGFTIAIDGPAASGKTTVGKQLADSLNYLFLDTGCMYRAVTLAALEANLDLHDETAVTQKSKEIDLDIHSTGQVADGRLYTVLLNNRDVTWEIRTPAVDANVSQVSKYIGVRQEMVKRQREYGRKGNVIMVGRDIGTVVMPSAPLKLYITASAAERANRRWHDRKLQGHEASFDIILEDVVRRDQIDSKREHSPLKPAADAIEIDTTQQPVDTILQRIMTLLHEKQGQR